MSAQPLDELLNQLSTGGPATEQLFRDYEPYLRMVVRRQLSPAHSCHGVALSLLI